ncbi:MAG TPA: glycosyl hydrolase 53 family protein [Mucilaginibacter sp.]|jgi:arabinogalactan endo-1,4-beta-galactosidase|nr:glycosyl hydrolase 53 family protein [Mucilaginibacter sp.]
MQLKNVMWCLTGVLFLTISCSSNKNTNPTPTPKDTYTPPSVSTTFAKGADISWVTQMESQGVKFYDKSGQQQDIFALMKSLGFNSIRLRAWVNPSDGWCNTADLLKKALRAQNAGMKIMVDFHYADSWADPGKQPKPAAWVPLSFNSLVSTLHDYTVHVMDTLKTNGITPDWVQVGNEVDDGMLWEDGRASTHMANFAALVEAGYEAVKSVSNTTKVIVHVSNGYDNTHFRWLFDGLKANNAHWDIVGMSLYPSATNYKTYDTECLANMQDMITRYGTPVMICEVGMSASDPTDSRDFLADIITKNNSLASGNGLGVFYWEPEAYNWQGYGLGAFDNTGKPTIALDAFRGN